MAIKKVKIQNYKIFKGMFCLELNPTMNIVVGNNEAGKSTILEAINLALTGLINGKYAYNELTETLFNVEVVQSYLSSLDSQEPPAIIIELYLDSTEGKLAVLQGNDNSEGVNDCGLYCKIAFAEDKYREEYNSLLANGDVDSLAIEYYEIRWFSFARKELTPRTIPIKSALIDSSSTRYQNGSDVYISRILRQNLSPDEIVRIARAHRKMRSQFNEEAAIKNINRNIKDNLVISDKEIELSVELLTKNAWESSLMTYFDKVPYHQIGKGEQSIIKTILALSDKKADEASIVLMEEPENHLSHTNLNKLMKIISEHCSNQQVLISTHSSFVANKLGLENLILIDNLEISALKDLSLDTLRFFKKLPGYNTLRIMLSKKVILVEGPSDELVVQKVYMQENNERLPIEDGTEVISVGTAFLRFLELVSKFDKKIAIVTDMDGKLDDIRKKYEKYESENILISYEEQDMSEDINADDMIGGYNYNSLEYLLFHSIGLKKLNETLGTNYKDKNALLKHMKNNKTECALKIFEYEGSLGFPEYLVRAVGHVKK